MVDVLANHPRGRAAATADALAAVALGEPLPRRLPSEEVFRQGVATLRHTPAPAGAPRRPPLFLCSTPTHSAALFDLLPDNSVVDALARRGTPVYLLDWGRPGPDGRHTTLGELVDELLVRMLRRTARHARQQGQLEAAERPDAFGHGLGGSLLALAVARHPDLAHRIALLSAPIDLHKCGRLTDWIASPRVPLDAIVDDLGTLPAAVWAGALSLLRPLERLRAWGQHWTRPTTPSERALWMALERWRSAPRPLPGAATREFVQRCCIENRLMTGGWELDGRPADLGQAQTPAVVFGATQDHLCPTPAAFGLLRAWGGPVRHALVEGGHDDACLGVPFHTVLQAWLDERRPDLRPAKTNP